MDASLLILYGSQTGNAQDVAERISREAKRLLFSPKLMPMDSFDVTTLPTQPTAIFVLSTTGQGEFPENARRFWKFLLRKGLPSDSLSGLKTAVFGLGDSGYPKYNVAAKKLSRRMAGLGASSLLDLGLGDDQHASGYEAGLDRWLQGMWSAMRAAHPLPAGLPMPVLDDSTVMQLGQPRYLVKLLDAAAGPHADSSPAPAPSGSSTLLDAATGPHADSLSPALPSDEDAVDAEDARLTASVAAAAAFKRVATQAAGGTLPSGWDAAGHETVHHQYGPERPFLAPMLTNKRITGQDHFQDVRHIELSIRGSGAMEVYQPGDLLSVWPVPEPAAVDAFLERLGLDGRQRIEVTPADPPAGQMRQVATGTIRSFVEGVLDVAGASPRRRLFQVLAHFTPESAELEKERLLYFASTEGRDDLYRYNQSEGRSLLEVLQDFRSCRPPLDWLLEASPLMKARQFSLASSCRMHPGEAHITVAVVEWITPYKRQRRGLCSSYLAGIKPRVSPGLPEHGENGVDPATSPSGHGAGSAGQAAGSGRVAVWVEAGCLRMPLSVRTPLILVGPGTGVAPFRSFLEERAVMLQQARDALDPGRPREGDGEAAAAAAAGQLPAPCWLFFGCRNRGSDCYYLEQWEELQREGVLMQPPRGLSIAASRDQPQKVYVTHKLEEHAAVVWDLLVNQGAHVYVSGSAKKMPSDVVAALERIAARSGGMPLEAAQLYVRQLELKGRYHVEAWS